MNIADFHGKHLGETCLLVGNGPNLHSTPPEQFSYPSIGMNTIHEYNGWCPTYYTAVDSRVWREFGERIDQKYSDIPCFIPYPNLKGWPGDNKVFWHHRPGPLWPFTNDDILFPSKDLMTEPGITYSNVMHVAMQLAWFMGFTTLLIIGMQHGKHSRDHFWGVDEDMSVNVPVDRWIEGYRVLNENMGIKMLNLSVDTCVPTSIIKRDDWRNWTNGQSKTQEKDTNS